MKKKESFSLTFIYLLMIAGFLCGLIISRIVDLSSVTALDSLLTTVNKNSDTYAYFVSQFVIGIIFILFIFFLGTSVIGIPAIAFVLFTRGVQIGFSCVLFVATYQLKGILGILLALLPQVLLDIAAIVIVAVFSIECSTHLLYCTLNPMKMNAKDYVNRGLTHLLLAFVFVLIGSYLKSTLILKLIELFNLI